MLATRYQQQGVGARSDVQGVPTPPPTPQKKPIDFSQAGRDVNCMMNVCLSFVLFRKEITLQQEQPRVLYITVL